jgi:hypothetical protein
MTPFVAKLDVLCRRGNAAAGTLASDLEATSKAHNDAAYAMALERLVSITAPVTAEIAKLTPPADLEGAFGRYKSAIERLRGIDLSMIAGLKARDAAALKRLDRLYTGARDTRAQAATDLGAKNCEAR